MKSAPNYSELLQVHPGVSITVKGPHDFLISGGQTCYLRQGEIFRAVLDCLTQPATADEVTRRLSGFDSAVPAAAIADLMRIGAIVPAIPGASRAEAAFRADVPAPREEQFAELVFLADGCETVFTRALNSFGIRHAAGNARAIVIADDYLSPTVGELLRERSAALLARPKGSTIWLGPLIQAGDAPCYECLAAAMRPHRWPMLLFAPDESPVLHPIGAHPASLTLAATLTAMATARWMVTGRHDGLAGTILTLDLNTLRQSRHAIRSRADCPNCGTGRMSAGSGELSDLVSPVSGIVSNTQTTVDRSGGLFHCRATFVHALPSARCRPLIRPHEAIGKGQTRQDAETAAIAEAAERYSLAWQGDERRIEARLRDIDAIHPPELLLFSDRQYATRDDWNSRWDPHQHIPERFDAHRAVEWCAAREIGGDGTRYVPARYCYMWYPASPGPEFCVADTNGCAAGPSMEDAILSAMLELVERDAVAIWWYNRLSRPAVRPESFDDGEILRLGDAMAGEGRDLRILDITTDLGIPAYAAIAANRDGSQPIFGCAAHVSPRMAALKAIREAIQIWFWVDKQAHNDVLIDFFSRATLENSPFLKSSSSVDAPRGDALRIGDAIRVCVDRLRANGIVPLRMDMTRPELRVPVARVIAPGLRHFWARFAPGRLYEVPVKMDWRATALEESELNPVPCMI